MNQVESIPVGTFSAGNLDVMNRLDITPVGMQEFVEYTSFFPPVYFIRSLSGAGLLCFIPCSNRNLN